MILGTKAAAALLGTSPRVLQAAAASGRVDPEPRRIGGRWLFCPVLRIRRGSRGPAPGGRLKRHQMRRVRPQLLRINAPGWPLDGDCGVLRARSASDPAVLEIILRGRVYRAAADAVVAYDGAYTG